MSETSPTLGELIAQLDRLEAQMRAETAPIDQDITSLKSRIKALDMQKQVALEPYAFQRETLQQAIRIVVQEQQLPQVRGEHFTVSYTERVQWDDAGLQAYAEEQPSVLQFRQVSPSTIWRWRT